MSHPVPWMEPEETEDLEETMTPEDIKKLPALETSEAVLRNSPGTDAWTRLLLKSISLEQQRDALMMALEKKVRGELSQEEARETLDAIRQMKEGK